MSTEVLLHVIDSLGNVDGLTPPAYRALVKCAASILLIEAPATAPIKERKRPGPKPGSRKAKAKRWSNGTGKGSAWRKAAAEKTAATKRAQKAEREAAKTATSISAAKIVPAANGGDATPAPNGGLAPSTGRMKSARGNNARRLAPATVFLRQKFEASSFLPLIDLAREASRSNIKGDLLGAAAQALVARKTLRGSVEGLEMPSAA